MLDSTSAPLIDMSPGEGAAQSAEASASKKRKVTILFNGNHTGLIIHTTLSLDFELKRTNNGWSQHPTIHVPELCRLCATNSCPRTLDQSESRHQEVLFVSDPIAGESRPPPVSFVYFVPF